MGLITLQVPVVGQPDATEDPKIASDMTILQTLLNGNLDTNNLSPNANITASQLAPGTIPSGTGGLAPVTSSATGTVAMSPGQMLTLTSAGAAGVLPSTSGLTVGTMCGVRAGPAIAATNGATTVGYVTHDSSNTVYHAGSATAQAGGVLGFAGSYEVVQWDGAFWRTIAGGQDYGWWPLTLNANAAAADSVVVPAWRYQQGMGVGTRVVLRGSLVTSSTINSGTAIATINNAVGFPSGSLDLPVAPCAAAAPSPPARISISSAGVITCGANIAALVVLPLNDVSYSLS